MADVESAQSQAEENIEGLDRPIGSGWGEYPLDSVFVRQETRTVSAVLDRVKRKRWILDPDFQRDFVWTADQQSKLIESCLMRIPLPVFYVAEAADGRIIVVDGLQRITTFVRYVENDFRLNGLDSKEIEGKFFRDLPVGYQERILDTHLIIYILDSKVPDCARLDVFERVNGETKLSRQQMRNAIYSGSATKWLRDMAQSQLFLQATGESLNAKTMRDREAINRFCAFILIGREGYRGDMDAFLALSLQKMNNECESLRKVGDAFSRSLKSNLNLFGKHAFRKSLALDDPSAERGILNISLFDVCTVMLAQIPEELTFDSGHGQRVKKELIELLKNGGFSDAVTYSTNSNKAVNTRHRLAEQALGLQVAL